MENPLQPVEIIDLTGEDACAEAAAHDNFPVIDLTEVEEEHPADFPHDAAASVERVLPPSVPTLIHIKKEMPDPDHGVPWDGAQAESPPVLPEMRGTPLEGCFSPVSSCAHSVCGSESSSSSTVINSDLGSLTSLQLDSDLSSCSSPAGSSRASLDCSTEEPYRVCQQRVEPEHTPIPPAQRQSPGPSSCPPASASRSPRRAKQPLLEISSPVLTAAKREPPEPARLRPANKAWLHKLRYFRGTPVHHLFHLGAVQDEETRQKAQPIPRRNMSMVTTTMEENFAQGTLQFLMDFVSCQHYPPKEIVFHVTRNILLSSAPREMLNDAYMLLMKIQMLHPANATTVGWDWELLRYVVEQQYVLQTLEDDFQLNLRLRFLQKSIAKKVLSCDQCFSNVKEVIEWLVAAVTGLGFSQRQEQQQKAPGPSSEPSRADSGIPSPGPDLAKNDIETRQAEDILPAFLSQKVVMLFQRMLSIAVEVDRSPNCSTNKIADVVFPYLVNIPLRSQREAFLNSMESQLLRCRVLELLFHHSCDVPTSLPLSLTKLLHFLSHSSPLLQYQDQEVTWQRWDEMLQHLILLAISYHTVVLGHLRSSLTDRMDLIISNAKPKLQNSSITPVDIELHIKDFSSQLRQILGCPLPPQLTDKVCMLRELLLSVAATT
ncbi:SUMO-interacting motif-containing protein 1 isoform X2 [Emydura macquarii macquarii]|uniref:SUMO-interacting motif-containing protein 1 isoform X2 n=1 Tax=Emydura macquarii macquarii TaxID=1129001 RepID=UPI00352A0B23